MGDMNEAFQTLSELRSELFALAQRRDVNAAVALRTEKIERRISEIMRVESLFDQATREETTTSNA